MDSREFGETGLSFREFSETLKAWKRLNDICCALELVANFECELVFFGLLGFKPKEPISFTGRGLRIVPSRSLKFDIPMNQVVDVNVDFVSVPYSIIAIDVTTEWTARIERSIEAVENRKIPTYGNYFTSSRIILVCENLPEGTKGTIRFLFFSIADIDVETAKKVLQILGVPIKNPTKLTISEPSLSSNKVDETAAILQNETISDDAKCEIHSEKPKLTETAPTEITISTTLVETSSDLNTINSPLNDARNLLVYEHASISVGDYTCLASGEYLNDKIIDFYLKYIYNNVIRTNEERKRTYIFSTLFYHVLDNEEEKTDRRSEAEARYKRVMKWTKNVNIFEKDFLIVPVNERFHWYLIIVCFPLIAVNSENLNNNFQQSDDIVKQPVILIFDSLAKTVNYRSPSVLRDYLTFEYNWKTPHATTNPVIFNNKTLPEYCVKVPQQDNLIDCGLYVLQYVEEFFKQPIKDFRLPIMQVSDWFDSMTITRKREEIAKLIERLIIEYHQAMGTTPKIKLPNITLPTCNGELV